MARRRRRKLKTWIYFPLAGIAIAIATLLFVLFGKGGIPNEAASITPTPDPSLATPFVPQETPEPEAKRLFRYFAADPSIPSGGKWGFISETGAVPIEAKYDKVQDFSEGLAFVAETLDGKLRYHLIDAKGNNVGQLSYDDVRPFSDGFAAVKTGSLWGFVDSEGMMRYNHAYELVSDFRSGMAAVKKDGKWGYLDSQSESSSPKIAPTFGYAQDFSQNLAVVGNKTADGNMTYFLIDAAGNQVLPLGNAKGSYFSEDYLLAERDGKYVFMNNAGVVQFGEGAVFEDAKGFSEGRAAVKKNGLWGFIDKSGVTAIECIYEDAQSFSGGFAAVKKNGKWAYVKVDGNPISDFAFDSAKPFANGYAEVVTGTSVMSMDQAGATTQLYQLQENATETQQKGTIKTTNGNANVRAAAQVDAALVTKLPNGQQIDITGSEGDWYRVNIGGIEGYVKKDFVVIATP